MRIGFMLRNLRDEGGIKVYTQNLLDGLFSLESKHEFFLLYPDSGLLGSYAGRPDVHEIVLKFPTKLGWDQLAVLYALLNDRKRDELFTLSDPGLNTLKADGSNFWQEQAGGVHHVLGLKEDPEQVAELIENLMKSR